MTMASMLSSFFTDALYASSTLTLYFAMSVSLLLYLIVAKKTRKSSGGRLPPGPPAVPVLGSLPFISFDLHTYFAALAQTYGPVFSLRLGARLWVVLSSPSAAREALKEHDAILASHEPTAAALTATYGGSNLVFAPYGPRWRVLRKVCARELLGNSGIEALGQIRRREVRRAVSALRLKAGGKVEIREVAFCTSLEVMRNMLWGADEGAGSEEAAAAEFKEVVDGLLDMMEAPNVSDFFPAVARWDIQGVGRRVKRLHERLDRLFETVIDRRMNKGGGSNGGKDFLHVLLDLLEKKELTRVDVKALLLDLIFGGTDTTSGTVEWAMAELLQNPDKLEKTQDELDAVVGKDRMVEESDIPHLPFLRSVVKEVLRLHPPLPLLIPRSPSEPCSIHGYMIPEEAKVFINVWAMQRDPANWDEPLSFKPERFINAAAAAATDHDQKYDFKGSNFSYLPFGSGRRICVGYNLGERMVTHELAVFLHSFNWKLPEGTRINFDGKFGITMKKKEPLVLVPTVRLEVYA